MFTGIVETMGEVVRVLRRGGGARLEVKASKDLVGSLQIGDSVSVNGACVTVTDRNEEVFAADLVPETVARTNLGILQSNEEVNLERPMRAGDRFGGHIVQGHVDAVGLVRSRRKAGAQEMLEITIPFELTRYIAAQGSVALDGVSLTVVAVDRDRFRVALIPHTVASTTLGRKGQGAPVNVEVDVLSKYVERHMAARAARASMMMADDAPREREPAAEQPARAAQPRKPEPPKQASRTKPAARASSNGKKPASRSHAKPAARPAPAKAAKGKRKR